MSDINDRPIATEIADDHYIAVQRSSAGRGVEERINAKKINFSQKKIKKVLLFGDSITAFVQNLASETANVARLDASWYLFACARAGVAPLQLVAGYPGATTAGLIAVIDDVVNKSADAVIVFGGTNDTFNAVDPTETIKNLISIYAAFQRSGKTVIATTIPAQQNTSGDAAQQAANNRIVAVNAWIREYCPANNILIWDGYNNTVNPQSAIGYAKTGLIGGSGNSVHFNQIGGYYLSLGLENIFKKLFYQFIFPLSSDITNLRAGKLNYAQNPLFTGSASAGGLSGTVPANSSIFLSNVTGTAEILLGSTPYNNKVRLTLTASAAGYCIFRQTISGMASVTGFLQGFIRHKLTDAIGVYNVLLAVAGATDTTYSFGQDASGSYYNASTAADYPDDEDFVLNFTPILEWSAANLTNLDLRINFGKAGLAVLEFELPTIIDYGTTDPRFL